MDDFSQFESLANFLIPVSEDIPCGENLENSSDEKFIRIERDINKAKELREWKALKKDIAFFLSKTKDFKLVAHYSKTALYTETIPVNAISQSLYLIHEYIDKYWDCVLPPEDNDDPYERFTYRTNAIAELGSWKSVVLPLRKKCPILSFDGYGEYFLEDLVAFKNGEAVEGKQPLKAFINELSSANKNIIEASLESFQIALKLAENIKKLLLEKTESSFMDFDSYLLPSLQDGVNVLMDLSPNTKVTLDPKETESTNNTNNDSTHVTTATAINSVKNRDDVVRLLDMICTYYAENEPSSPIPLLLKRARRIAHKDFLEVLEELVPDSISMTESVFGKPEEDEN